ncbi:SphA family protein [Photobacterium nomapromontoriensis]|uniref:SphA family protein n=1 Tax=Photobacterium nomapromontoriensis TaxID=2910237 RepID=UPI003D10C592
MRELVLASLMSIPLYLATVRVQGLLSQLCLLMVLVGFPAGIIRAAEGGRVHHLPLSGTAVLAPQFSPSPGVDVTLTYAHTDGVMPEYQTVSVAGLLVDGLKLEENHFALSVFWQPDWETAQQWSYTMGLTLPFVSVNAASTVNHDGHTGQERYHMDSARGLGDIVLFPMVLQYALDRHWHGAVNLAVYAPTGDFQVGRLANPGLNYWTFEPAVSLSYLEPAQGQAFSIKSGIGINTENPDTDYHSGAQFYLESSLSQYVMFFGGFTGLGVTGYWSEQLTGDSGRGAVLGDFNTRRLAVGPVLSYKAGWADVEFSLSWLHEINSQHQLKGDTLSFQVQGRY